MTRAAIVWATRPAEKGAVVGEKVLGVVGKGLSVAAFVLTATTPAGGPGDVPPVMSEQKIQIKMSRGPESPQSEFHGVGEKELADIAKNHPDAQKRRRAVREQKIRKQRNVAKRTGGKKKKADDKSKPGSDPSKPGAPQPTPKPQSKPEPKPNDPPDGGLGNHDENLPSHDK
jgi:hypothetical protein